MGGIVRRFAAVLAVVLPVLVGCAYQDPGVGSMPAPSPSRVVVGKAACKAAIRAQYEPGTAKLTGAPTRPPECVGLSNDQLSRIVTAVIEENTK